MSAAHEMPPRPPEAPRLAIVCDDDAALRSLSELLAASGFDVMPFDSAAALLRAVPMREPDALLVDLRMPDVDGLALIEQLRDRGYPIPAVFLSGHADVPTSVKAIRAGALDFLEEPCDERTLIAALQRAVDMRRRSSARATDDALRARWRSLTPRERQVCRHVVQGRLNKQIAATLGTSEKTIKVHRARGMMKMGAKSLAELVRALDRLGEGDPDARDAPITERPLSA